MLLDLLRLPLQSFTVHLMVGQFLMLKIPLKAKVAIFLMSECCCVVVVVATRVDGVDLIIMFVSLCAVD